MTTQSLPGTRSAQSTSSASVAYQGSRFTQQCKLPSRPTRIHKPRRYKVPRFAEKHPDGAAIPCGDIILRRCIPYVVYELPYKQGRHHTIFGSLGSGGAGDVFLASTERRWHAIKVFKRDFEGRAECDIQPRLRHPNIVKSICAFISDGDTYVELELCANGSLLDWLRRGPVPEAVASKWIIQLAGGIKFMHSKGVGHGDIKPENILLDDKGNAKLSDFSHAAYFEAGGSAKAPVGGTPRYMAPEAIQLGENSRKSDIWSFGVVIYAILLRDMAFRSRKCRESSCTLSTCHESHNEEIRKTILAYNWQWPNSHSSAAKSLIEKIFVLPERRPSLDDIVKAGFFTRRESYFMDCRSAGVGESDIGELYPCVGRYEPRTPFWVLSF